MPSKDPESVIDKEIRKISARNDELIKQDGTLKKGIHYIIEKSIEGDNGTEQY